MMIERLCGISNQAGNFGDCVLCMLPRHAEYVHIHTYKVPLAMDLTLADMMSLASFFYLCTYIYQAAPSSIFTTLVTME